MKLLASTSPTFRNSSKSTRSAPGRLQLGLDDIDWVITGLHFGRGQETAREQEMHRFEFGRLTVRTTSAFDWLRFLREWRLEFSEAHQGGHAYFKIIGHLQPFSE